jgi:hypothetical protein
MNIDEIKTKTKKLASLPTSEGLMNVKRSFMCSRSNIYTKEERTKGKYLAQQQIRIGSNGK